MKYSSLPFARSRLYYNPHSVYIPPNHELTNMPSSYWSGYLTVRYSSLEAVCHEEGTVIIGNAKEHIALLNAERNTQAIDKALGRLYEKQPALPLSQRK